MPTFNVHLIQTVSTTITLEAESPEDAVDRAWNHPDMPGSMVYGAFGQSSVDESGEWEATEVTDEDGDVVWSNS